MSDSVFCLSFYSHMQFSDDQQILHLEKKVFHTLKFHSIDQIWFARKIFVLSNIRTVFVFYHSEYFLLTIDSFYKEQIVFFFIYLHSCIQCEFD